MVELLAPAGNFEKLKIAVAYGADALYGGVSHFSLRNRSAKEFTYETFKEAVEYAHAFHKKIYVTINGFPFNSQIKLLAQHIEKMADIQADAFIISAPGVLRLAQKIAPHIPIHLSTQANVLNVLDAEFFYEMGVKRIIAAREMSLNDLKEIKKALPNLELEIFVHGSMCFAFSGRCLISSLQHGRVPNRGSCANDCRFDYEYFIQPPHDNNMYEWNACKYFVREPDTGVVMRLEEEEGVGTHIFNAKDLNLVAHIQDIIRTKAVDSLKIEGRTKSSYYAAITTKTYKKAINDSYNNEFHAEDYMAELYTLKNRGFTDGYIIHRPFVRLDTQNHQTAISEGSFQVVAEVREDTKTALAKFSIYPYQIYEIISPAEIIPQENGNGKIYADGGRFFIFFKKIITLQGKELESIHSGNTNPIVLPGVLAAYSFLRFHLGEEK